MRNVGRKFGMAAMIYRPIDKRQRISLGSLALRFRRVILLPVLLFAAPTFHSLAAEQLDYRFSQMWPHIDQPWYFNHPNDVAVGGDGRVYVADTWNNRIQVFEPDGRFVASWGSEGSGQGQFHSPQGIATDTAGRVYVSDTYNRRIQVYDGNGNYVTAWTTAGAYESAQWDYMPTSIDVDGAGHVYVAFKYDDRVAVFNEQGRVIQSWGGTGGSVGQFDAPEDIAVDTSGNVYVADSKNYRVQVFNSSGSVQRSWDLEISEDDYTSYIGLAIDKEGKVYVVHDGILMPRAQVFDTNGNLLQDWKILPRSVGVNATYQAGPSGIAVASTGRLYISDWANDGVHVYDQVGEFLLFWGSQGSSPGYFDDPVSVSVGVDGLIYVAEGTNDRVQVLSSNGQVVREVYGKEGAYMDFDPRSVAQDQGGDLYVLDAYPGSVEVFSADGDWLRSWGSKGDGEGEFMSPTDIAVDHQGQVLVLDTGNERVQYFRKDGELIKQWAIEGIGEEGGYWSSKMAVAESARLYVTDNKNDHVLVFDSNGRKIAQWGASRFGDEPGQFSGPTGIAISDDGLVFVADTFNDRIQIFEMDGTFVDQWHAPGSGPGEFSTLLDLAFGHNGELYLADTGNNRIQKLTPAKKGNSYGDLPKTPRALIIGGRTAKEDALDNSVLGLSLRQAYTALQAQGYKNDDDHEEIRVLWNGPPVSLPSGQVLPAYSVDSAHFTAASDLTQWAQSGDRLLVYLIGHGEHGSFYLDAAMRDTLSAQALDGWLRLVEPELDGDVTLIYEACHSGSFLPTIGGPNRTVLTSAAAEERALFLNHGLNSYSYTLWSELYMGADLKQAHEKASLDMQVRSGPPQTPQLEADGNGSPNEKGDLEQAEGRCIGIGVNDSGELITDCLVAAAPSPVIARVAPSRTLHQGQSAELWLEPDPAQKDNIIAVWAVIARPDFVPDPNQSFDQLPVVNLSPDPIQGKSRWSVVYEPGGQSVAGESYRGFDVDGEYGITYYIKNRDGLVSTPMVGTVIKGDPVAAGQSPALLDRATGQLTLDGLAVGRKSYNVTLFQSDPVSNTFKLDSLTPVAQDASSPLDWDNSNRSVRITDLDVSNGDQPYSAVLKLIDRKQKIFELEMGGSKP